MKYKLVYVKWEDSMTTNGKWSWDDEIDFENIEKKSFYVSVGFLIKKDKRGIFLSQSSRMEINEIDGSASVTEPMYIPNTAIKNIKILKS